MGTTMGTTMGTEFSIDDTSPGSVMKSVFYVIINIYPFDDTSPGPLSLVDR
jgi:hypothetical protein